MFRKIKSVCYNHHNKTQPNPRKVSLLRFALMALFVVNTLYAIINVIFKFHKHYMAIGIMEAVVALLSLLMYVYYIKTKNLTLATNATIIILTIMLIIFFALAGSGKYAFYWICIYPPVVYFLFESKKANVVVGIFCAYMLVFMVSPYSGWDSTTEKVDSIINIVGATIGLVFFIRYFDISRLEAAYEIEEKNKELEQLVQLDYLTGLYNRIKLEDVLSNELKKASNGESTFSIIMSDLDNFKRINDTFGHLVGDSVLVDTAQILKNSCLDTCVVGRCGGEEFLIICPKTNKLAAKTLGKKILREISEHKYIIEVNVSISLGVTEYIKGDSTDTILRRADKALYNAKERGKGRVETI